MPLKLCSFRGLVVATQAFLLTSALITPPPASAHLDAKELIVGYNALIDAGTRDPKVYYDRGVAWRSLNRYDEAASDLKKALELDPGFLLAHYQLPRLLAAQGSFQEALQAAERAIEVARQHTPASEAHCWGVMARVELARHGFRPALAALGKAFELHPAGDLDWSLAEADALRGLGKPNEAIKALKRSYDRTRSLVLRNAWLDAMLEGGRGTEALPIIEAELAVRPLKSSWLIRRARARLSANETNAAHADLRLAVEELGKRISADHPDVTLLVERGMAWALLGDPASAVKDFGLATRNGASRELLAPAERLLSAQAPPAP